MAKQHPHQQPLQAEAGSIKSRSDWFRQGEIVRPFILASLCLLIIGCYGLVARSGLLEARAARASDTYYNLLVDGFRAGQLNLKTTVPPGLAQLSDPYDFTANADYRVADNFPVHDMSYFHGKLYLYFGITPVLLFWPYEALTGSYLSHEQATLIFFGAVLFAAAGLLWAIWRRYFAEVSFGVLIAGTLAMGLGTYALLILPRCDVYEVAISCGSALMMLALVAIWQALHARPGEVRWLAAASLAYGLAVGARPSLLFGGIILLLPVIQTWREHRKIWRGLVAATVPMLLVGLGLAIYNFLRFGHLLEFGEHYQMTSDPHRGAPRFDPHYFWLNFRVYFLQPARWSGQFPFAHDIAAPPIPAGHSGIEHPFGVLANIPIVWLAFAAPLAWRGRSEEARSRIRWFVIGVALLFGLCAMLLSFFMTACIRYQIEYTPTLMLLAVIGILGLERELQNRRIWLWLARGGWTLLLVFSIAFNLLASFDRQAEADAGLGTLMLNRGRIDEAIIKLERSLKFNADRASAHSDLGIALFHKGQFDEGIVQFSETVRLQPTAPETHDNLAKALVHVHRIDEAIEQYQIAVNLDPKLSSAQGSLADLLLQRGRIGEAVAHYEAAVAAQPDDAQRANNLAWILATSPEPSIRNGSRAVQLAETADRLTGNVNPIILETLAAAYAEAGRFSNAVLTATRGLELAKARTNAPQVRSLQGELKLYQAGAPFRDSYPTNSGPGTGR